MALKTERVYYVARNEEAALVDITARILRNGVLAAASVALTEVDAVNQPGVYVLTLAPATLTGYGGAGEYEFYINSASKDAPAVTRRWILANDEDDVEAHLATIEGKVDVIDQNVDDVEAAIVSGVSGLAAIKTAIDSLSTQVSSIQNNTNFEATLPDESIRPGAGNNNYRIPVTVFDSNGNLEDPDSNQIEVTVTNYAGTSRKSILAGYVDEGTPIYATRDSLGKYRIDYAVAAAATLEQLIFQFAYLEGALAKSHRRVTTVVADVQAAGFALESTAQSILTDTNAILVDTADMQPRVSDIQTKVNDGTYGLAAIKTALDLKASQASVDAAQGAGFDTGTDSLRQISLRVFTGGKAI